jgi:hypothetical protein
VGTIPVACLVLGVQAATVRRWSMSQKNLSPPTGRLLELWGLAPWTDVSDHHGVLLTSAGWGTVFG